MESGEHSQQIPQRPATNCSHFRPAQVSSTQMLSNKIFQVLLTVTKRPTMARLGHLAGKKALPKSLASAKAAHRPSQYLPATTMGLETFPFSTTLRATSLSEPVNGRPPSARFRVDAPLIRTVSIKTTLLQARLAQHSNYFDMK